MLAALKDHPRRCGENGEFIPYADGVVGSPPQVRGKLYCFACGAGGDGITPAGAGKTVFRRGSRLTA